MTATLPDLAPDRLLWEETLPGGCHWSWVLPRGVTLRLTALGDDANLSLVLDRKSTRLNSSHVKRSRMPSSA